MAWWQECFVILARGISWSLPILSVFGGLAWFINWLIKDTDLKKAVKKRLTIEAK